jgi:meso-butanediol dehydrogenase/(S,S)-butanediol dehydrogenase/diacetyl reductase
MRFEGKVVVVTGAASGIGQATAERFHREGAAVVVADIDQAAGEAAAAGLGQERSVYQHVDVRSWEQVQALVSRAEEAFGGLDVLVNNAGIGVLAATPETALEDWDRVIGIDLNGVFYGCRAAIPIMRRRGGGSIINMASLSGLAGDYSFAAYNAAKGGVVNYTRAAAIDHARDGVRINCICPGPIDTPIMRGAAAPKLRKMWEETVPMGRFGRPEEIAAAAAFLASEDATYITGIALSVDGGLLAHTGQPDLPRFFRENPQG